MSEGSTSLPGRGWPRAAVLFGVTMATAVIQPSLLVAVPFLALAAVLGAGRPAVVLVAAAAAVLAFSGPREGLWYVERAWALVLSGWFAALSLRWPSTSLFTRALGAVAGSVVAAVGVMSFRSGTWEAVDFAISDRMGNSVSTALQVLTLMRDGEALSPALVTTAYQAVEAQALVFPAMLGLASMAGLGVAWWIYVRLTSGSDQGVGPLKDFRFNDHLVWIFIGGLMLLLVRSGDAQARIGANAVVFMGLLYALRGAAVVMFLSSGLSALGYVSVVFALVFIPPVVIGAAMLIGVGDTWLNIRARAEAQAT